MLFRSPTTTSLNLRVGNVIAEAWAFAADFAYRCHRSTPSNQQNLEFQFQGRTLADEGAVSEIPLPAGPPLIVVRPI